MTKNRLKNRIIIPLSISLIISAVLIVGCTETNQKKTNIDPQIQREQIDKLINPRAEDNQINKFISPQTEGDQISRDFTPQIEGDKIYKFISPEEAFTLIKENQDNPNFVIIDDRRAEQFRSGHIKGAININYAHWDAAIRKLDKNKIYLVYCRTGCGVGSMKMNIQGFKYVYDIDGGLNAWTSKGFPLE
jgi:rhodanese-related sulfurtransferase